MGYVGGVNDEQRRLAVISQVRRVRTEREAAFAPAPLRCQDCRFGPLRSSSPDRCEHFAHWHISPDRKLRIPVTTEQARSGSGLCGPDALLFEPYGWRIVPRWLARQNPEDAVWYVLGSVVAAGFVIALFG